MAMQGRRLSRPEVLAWNEPWSYTDLARITAALDAVPNGVGVCIVPPSGGYIGVWVNNQQSLVIYPGYLAWRNDRWTKDLPSDLFPEMQAAEHDHWHELSTFRPHVGGRMTEEPAENVCERCRMALPLTGVCDTCG